MFQNFFEAIESSDVITIYRHVGADSDALGSQFGLKTWIKERYPDKKVYALGDDVGSCAIHFPPIDHIEDEVIQESLAIILDSANSVRIDDNRWSQAKQTMKIDHHIIVEEYGDIQIVDEKAGATCEILAKILLSNQEVLSSKCASFLYSGLIADTIQFSISTVSSETLIAASYLAKFGIDIPAINAQNFSKKRKEYDYETYLRSNLKMCGSSIAYVIITKEEYEAFHLTFNEAKEKVYAFANVEEFHIWALFVENHLDDEGRIVFNGSLRSKKVAINDIANKYHGGGHKLACGVKYLYEENIEELLNELSQRIS